MNTQIEAQLIQTLEANGPTPASTLMRKLGITQTSLSRLIRAAGPAVIKLGAARATRYVARRAVAGVGSAWPLYAIDATGRGHAIGELIALAQGQFVLQPEQPLAALGIDTTTHFADLPWFLFDARPQGFLGRALARAVAQDLDVPADPDLWNAAHTIRAWLAHGDNLPGAFVLGDAMMARVQRTALGDPAAIDEAQRPDQYRQRADAVMSGDAAGSSAGGEQPKFTTCVRAADGAWRHVLVKFTEAQQSPSKRRWADLLVAEHHALEALRHAQLPASHSELVIAGERLCLEVTRFDRIGAHGRIGVVSLRALAAEYDGRDGAWPEVAMRLATEGLIDGGDAQSVRTLWWFGRLIANTDMHPGNLSFFLGTTRPLALAPIYDMLPMLYRPASNAEIVPRQFEPPLPLPGQRAAWETACVPALDCWERIASDARVSLAFRAIARANGAQLAELRARI